MIVIVMLLSFLSSAVHLLEGILIKKYNEKHNKGGFVFTAIVSLFSMLFFVITDKGGLNFSLKMLPYGIIAGIFYCTASFLTFVALGSGPFAISKLILSYGGIFSICYGIFFLKEAVNVFTVIGICLMLLSIFLNRTPKAENEKKASLKWLISITLSVVGSGMYGIIQKEQQRVFDGSVDNEFMIISLGFSAIVLFIIGFISDGKDTFYILKHGALYASCAGLSNGITNFIIIYTNALMPIMKLSPIRSGVGIIFTFIVSKLIFKEKFLKRQLIGFFIGAAALILINL